MVKTAKQAKAIFEKHGAEFLRLSRPSSPIASMTEEIRADLALSSHRA
jgi:hypothetical protein